MKSSILIAGLAAIGFVGVAGVTHASGRAGTDLAQCISEYSELMGFSEQIETFMAARSPADLGKTPEEVLASCREGNAILSASSREELDRIRAGSGIANAMIAANPDLLEVMAGSLMQQEQPLPETTSAVATSVPSLSVAAAAPLPTSDGGRIEFVRIDIGADVLASEIAMVRRSGKSDCSAIRAYSFLDPDNGQFDAKRGALLHCSGQGEAFLLSAYSQLYLREAAAAEAMFFAAYHAPIETIEITDDRVALAFGTGD